MTLNKTIHLPVAIFLILSTALIAFVIWPLFKQIKVISQGFSSEKSKIVYLNEEKNNIQKIKNIYNTYQPDLSKIENLFFDPDVPISFIGFLEKSANNIQMKLEISSMTKKTDKEDLWPSLSVQMVTTGSFSNFSKFIKRIENGPYLIEITDLNARKLTENEISAAKLENIVEPDTAALLTIKVFTR